MDIEQFFTDINIHGKEPKKATSPNKLPTERSRLKERDITSIYG